jgi:hypothetical protein
MMIIAAVEAAAIAAAWNFLSVPKPVADRLQRLW